MSNYVFGSNISYLDYLQTRSFLQEITSASGEAVTRVSMEISQRTLEVIASTEALAIENIQVMEYANERLSSPRSNGFSNLSCTDEDSYSHLTYDLQDISAGRSELNATFHWSFGQMIAGMGRMNDALSELVKIAKTPVQTTAYNHYEIARDAFRRGLYQECLESLNKAINGDHTFSGYKLEWRFHQMKGILQLGFVNGDMTLVDLAAAEESFVLAARYARVDYPNHTALAFLSAGWATYVQGKMKEGLDYAEQSLAINPNLGEALFLAAKMRMAFGDVDTGLLLLSKAIDIDRFYTLKAAGDGDFQRHEKKFRTFLDTLRKEKYRQAAPNVRKGLEKFLFWLKNAPEAKKNSAIRKVIKFIGYGENWLLLDILNVIQTLPELLAEIEKSVKGASITKRVNGSSFSVPYEKTTLGKETYQEKVVIKPRGLFHQAVTEMQTKTRTVRKRVRKKRSLQGIRLDLFNGLGSLKSSFDFCLVPYGSFSMGEKSYGPIHQVTIHADFYLGKYPVTQAQWEALMGRNPSFFKGGDLPVEFVSWNDCQEFIKRLNEAVNGLYRLPTEAEWEYACRAGSTGAYCCGDSKKQLGEYAWYSGNSGNQTQPVGKKKANAWGLHDMHGNVWEWCQDWFGQAYYKDSPVKDPAGPSAGEYRVIRGGSWRDKPNDMRAASRNYYRPIDGRRSIGFRLAGPK